MAMRLKIIIIYQKTYFEFYLHDKYSASRAILLARITIC